MFAIIWVPLGIALPATFATLTAPGGHGHELLFGFVLAVVAGFLSTKVSPTFIWTLLVTWCVARFANAFGPLAPIAGLSFPVAVVGATVPPLFAGAKRPQNRIVPVIVLALLAADCAWWATAWFAPQWQQRVLLATVDLYVRLILIVGGRTLQATIGGYLERHGLERHDPVGRGYELPLAALCGAMMVCDAMALEPVAGACGIAVAALTLHRILPWQLQHVFGHARL